MKQICGLSRRFRPSRSRLRLASPPPVTRSGSSVRPRSPFTQAVVEEFSNMGNAAPVLESTGTGGGMQIFCGGSASTIRLTGASRAMTESEYNTCLENGVDTSRKS